MVNPSALKKMKEIDAAITEIIILVQPTKKRGRFIRLREIAMDIGEDWRELLELLNVRL